VRWSTLSGLLVGSAAVPESIAALAQGVTQAMLLQTVKVCGLATILTVGAIGTLVVAQQEKTSANHPTGRKTDSGSVPSEQIPAPNARPLNDDERRLLEAKRREIEELYRRLDIEQKQQHILRMLDTEVKLDLPPATTLDQFLKAIKQSTIEASPPGLPIYVDPVGLQESQARIDGPVDCFTKGPLRDVLRQTLRQLNLSYVVKDGFLTISSRADITDQRLDELDRKVDRLLNAMERLERSKEGPSGRGPGL
jgi:hypothetical protein